MKLVQLDRAISKLGYASRSQARDLITSGRVRLNGRVISDPTRRVNPVTAHIEIDDAQPSRDAWTLIALHKPRGVVTTRHDPDGRRTVYDLLHDLAERVVPVGRLDLASTGLLLLTNDTQLANWLTDPAARLVRTYIVTVRGALSDETVGKLLHGIRDRGDILAAPKIDVLKRSGRETHLSIELTEGKNREIRRMMKHVGHEVTRLKRIAFGGVTLGDLASGKWRDVPLAEARRVFADFFAS